MSALSDSIKISGRQSEFQIACHAANSFCNQNECTVEEIYHVQNIMKNLNCGSGIDANLLNKVSLRLETSTDIREVFMGVSLLKQAGKSIATICQKLAEWVPNHGNPTYQPKKHTSDLLPTRLVMETAKLCGDEKVSDQVRNFFVKRIGRINRDSAVILDKRNSYGLTSFFVADALERRANGQQLAGVRDADISSMIASLQEFSSDEDFEAVRDNLRVSEALNKIGVAIPKIDSFKLRNIGSGAVVRWTYTDILGNIVKGPSRATVKYEDRTDEVNESQVTLKTQKKDLTVEIIQSVNGFTYTSRHQVHIGQDLSIIQVRMATTKGNERIKEFPYEEGGSIICNQDNKLHIQFKLDKDIEAEYAAFYLKHSEIKEFDRITAASALTYNQDQSSFRSDLDKYTGTIDMGDTEQVQPVGGKYRLIVVIADRSLNEIIQKSVATVHLSFNTEVAIKDVLDSTMPQIEEIYPTLYPPKYYNFMLNVIMSVVVVIVTLVILKNQIGQDWNTKLYPTGATQILWTYAFWVVFGLLYGLLIFYWLNERFMDIVFHLGILMGAALLTGNFALRGLARKYNSKENHEKTE